MQVCQDMQMIAHAVYLVDMASMILQNGYDIAMKCTSVSRNHCVLMSFSAENNLVENLGVGAHDTEFMR
jgi:hypothetical protein